MVDTVKVVEPAGILDSTQAPSLRKAVDLAIEEGAKIILIDLRDVTFVDSSGLGALVVALKTVRSTNGKLYICSINEQVRILFELTSMDQVFSVFVDRAAFEHEILANV